MDSDWISLQPWGDFPDRIEKRCDSIAQHVVAPGRHREQKHNGSYSFQATIDGHPKTVAKLVPQFAGSAPIILVAFSPLLPKARDFARQFDWREEGTIMHETFYLSGIPDDWSTERVAAIIREFLDQAPPAGPRVPLF